MHHARCLPDALGLVHVLGLERRPKPLLSAILSSTHVSSREKSKTNCAAVPLNDIGVDVPSLRLCRQEQGAVTQLEHLGLDKSMATLRAVKAGVLLQLDAAVEHMDCYSPPNSEERECSLSDLKT